VSRIWVVNASPLITLAQAGHLDLILRLCPDPLIPSAVANEIAAGPETDPARRWLKTEGQPRITTSIALDSRVVSWDLGGGETEVLSLALSQPGGRSHS
jgi:predicted nucleic acid-binding protein